MQHKNRFILFFFFIFFSLFFSSSLFLFLTFTYVDGCGISLAIWRCNPFLDQGACSKVVCFQIIEDNSPSGGVLVFGVSRANGSSWRGVDETERCVLRSSSIRVVFRRCRLRTVAARQNWKSMRPLIELAFGRHGERWSLFARRPCHALVEKLWTEENAQDAGKWRPDV